MSKILNKRTGRENDRKNIAKQLRRGTLSINEIEMPVGLVWTGQRFNSERTVNKKFKDRLLTPAQVQVSPYRLYNPLTRRWIERSEKNIAKIQLDTRTLRQNKLQTKMGRFTTGETQDINMIDLANARNFINFFTTGDRAGKFIIRFENGRVYTLSQDTLEEVLGLLDDDTKVSSIDSRNEIAELMRGNNTAIFERLRDVAPKPNGGFFPYHHKIPRLDLSELDIYNSYTGKTSLDENCLLVALKSAGVKENKLNRAKMLFKCGNIPKCKLGEIANSIGVSFQLRSSTNPKQIECIGNPEKFCIHLGLICSHYFHNKQTDYTSFSIKHFDEIDEPEDKWWGDAWSYQDKAKGTFKYDPKRARLDGYNLILLLLSDPDRYLNDLSNEITAVEETPYYSKIKKITCLEYAAPEEIMNPKTGKPTGKFRGDCIPTTYKERRPQEYADIIFYDVETCKQFMNPALMDDENYKRLWEKKPDASIHTLFQLCYSGIKEKFIHTLNETEGNGHTPKKMLNNITKASGETADEIKKRIWKMGMSKEEKQSLMENNAWKKHAPKIILYAHNGGYDLRFIRKYLWNFTLIQNGNSLICANATYRNGNKWIAVEFRDTYKLITKKLEDFGKMFDLPFSKEYMPYDLYTYKNVFNKGIMPLKEVLKSYIPKRKKDQFLDCCKRANNAIYIEEGVEVFDLLKYSQFYCRRDVEVMRAGFLKFGEWIDEALGIDITQFYTVPSIANEYLMKTGCYDDTYSISGVVREFINRALVGGRTMLCENTKQIAGERYGVKSHKNIKIADFDGTSLYSSSMEAMDGFLRGMPTVIDTQNWEEASGYFVELKINDIKKHRKFPMMSFIDPKKGTRNFSDLASDYKGKTVVVDKIMLGIWKEYHDVDYTFIRGYMFNEGHNPQIKTTIREIFNNRLLAKNETYLNDGTQKVWTIDECLKEIPEAWVEENKDKVKSFKNAIQEVWKLIMNCGYGKAITRPHDTKDYYIPEDNYLDHIARYYNWVKQADPIITAEGSKQMWCIKQIEPIATHANYAHIGIEILSQSKRIMADVMYLAEDNDFPMFTTDTDSIHMNLNDVEPLGELFKNKYKRELIGSDLGQFHTDFEFKGCRDIYSRNLIALAKKCYIDELVGIDKKTGEEKIAYHIRMKGVKDKAILRVAKEQFDGDCLALYKYLYDGFELEFDLTKGVDDDGYDIDIPCFEYHKSWIITNKQKFGRIIKF